MEKSSERQKHQLTEIKELKKYGLYIYNPDYNDFRFCANITKTTSRRFFERIV